MYLLIIKKAYPKVLKGPVVLGSSLIDKIKRGFLDGRINKKQYQLILRLSNMELKKI